MNYTAIGLLLVSALFFVIFLFVSIKTYNSRFSKKYDLRNYYPFELNYESHFKLNLYGNIALIISLLSLLVFYVLFDNKHNNGFMIFASISGVLSVAAIGMVLFIPLKYLKAHLASSVFLFAFSFLLPGAIAIANINFYNTNQNWVNILLCVLAIIICLVIFGLICNPKLSKWGQAEKIVNPDGSITYTRPKYFILAFTEWLLIISVYLSSIILLITIFFN